MLHGNVDPKKKENLWGNGTSYGHEILHGVRGDMYKPHNRFESITFCETWKINIWIRPKFSVKMADQSTISGYKKAK